MKLFIIAYTEARRGVDAVANSTPTYNIFFLPLNLYATRPCQMIGPVFEKMASENPGITFVKVDVDDSEEIAAACGISAMPTFQFFKGGEKIDEFKGANTAQLQALVAKYK